MAEGFAARGHRVLGCARDPEQLATLSSSLGGEHDFQAVDLAGDGVEPWVEELLGRYGDRENVMFMISH